MSRRSILLATVSLALATSAAINEASAHGGGGGMAQMPSLPASSVEHLAPIAHTKAAPEVTSEFTHHKVFKAGNGLTPTGDGTSPPLPHLIRLVKPTIPPAVNLPPQVATQSVPPSPIKAGTGAITTKATLPSTAFPPVTVTTPANPVGNGVPAKPVGPGVLVGKPGIPTEAIPAKPVSVEPGVFVDKPAIPTGVFPVKAGTIIDKPGVAAIGIPDLKVIVVPPPFKAGTTIDRPTLPAAAFPELEVLKLPPPSPPTPTQTPSTHPMPTGFGGGVVIAGDLDLTDAGGSCYWIKRKFLTQDGEVIRHVKVCEITDPDQPE
jgi:hypothetical protein